MTTTRPRNVLCHLHDCNHINSSGGKTDDKKCITHLCSHCKGQGKTKAQEKDKHPGNDESCC